MSTQIDIDALERAAQAARAAGANIIDSEAGPQIFERYAGDGSECYRIWAPKDDDGDSRRLEVALFLTVAVRLHEIEVFNEYGDCLCSIPVDHKNDDLAAATRLAVLRAAAHIRARGT